MSQFSFTDKKHGQDLLRRFNELRKTGTFCDVVLKVRDSQKDFPAHSQLLTAISPYFNKLYKENNQSETILDDLNDNVLEIILDFIYTGTVVITTRNARNIFKASVLLQLESLKKECLNYMTKIIIPQNCFQLMLIGGEHECPELLEKTREYIAENFMNFVVKDEFLRMEAKYMKAIIASDNLMIKNENVVYQAVKKWIEHDFNDRLKYIPLLLSQVRFRFLPREFLKKTYTRDPVMMTSLLAQDFVHEALIYETLPAEEQKNVHTARVKQRWCAQSLDVISLLGGSEDDSSATGHWVFDPASNQWYTACPLLSSRYHFGLARHGNQLYILGGSMSDGCEKMSTTIEVYDPKLNQWKSITKAIKQERSRFDAVSMGEIIYFVGGMCSDPHRNTLERFFVSEKRKDAYQLSLPKQPRYDHCTVVLHGKIYFIGGCTRGHSALKTVECYNPQTNSWSDIAPLLVPRSGACAVVVDNCIVVIGGSNEKKPLNSCEIYDFGKEQWEYISPMNERRDHCSAVVFEEKIYVFGGSYGQVIHNSVECYSNKGNKWKVVTHLPSTRRGFKCIASVVNRSLVEKISFEQV